MAEATLIKKVGDVVKVHIDIANMQLSSHIGFKLYYPADILAPVGTGTGNAVQFTDGDIFTGREVEVVANNQTVDGVFWVYVSKVMKAGTPLAASGRVITLDFQAVGVGEGAIFLDEVQYGDVTNGWDYESTDESLMLTLEEPPAVVVAHLTITAE